MYVSPLFWHYRWSSSSLFVNKQRLDSPPLGILLVPLSCLEILFCGTVVQDSSLYEVGSYSVFFFFIGDLPPPYALPPTIPTYLPPLLQSSFSIYSRTFQPSLPLPPFFLHPLPLFLTGDLETAAFLVRL